MSFGVEPSTLCRALVGGATDGPVLETIVKDWNVKRGTIRSPHRAPDECFGQPTRASLLPSKLSPLTLMVRLKVEGELGVNKRRIPRPTDSGQ